ncbi:unnamed protein product, partial [Scytosiphon promiscuus]
MREGGGRAAMALLLASRRGLSLATSYSAASARVRCAVPAVRYFSPQILLPTLSTPVSKKSYCPSIPHAQVAQQRYGNVRALVAPLSMAAARSSPKNTINTNNNNNNSSSGAGAGGSNADGSPSSNKRKPRHTTSTSSRTGEGGGTNAPGGARQRLTPGTAPIGGRSTGAAPWGASGGR